jgi:hypothetical protein
MHVQCVEMETKKHLATVPVYRIVPYLILDHMYVESQQLYSQFRISESIYSQ